MQFIDAVGRAAFAHEFWAMAELYYETLRELENLEAASEEGRANLAKHLGYVKFRLGKHEHAERLFREYLDRIPGDLRVWAHVGQLLEAQGRMEESRGIYEMLTRPRAGNSEAESIARWAREQIARLDGEGGSSGPVDNEP